MNKLGPATPRGAALARAVTHKLRRFVSAEWAYSSIDRGYFLRNEFQECLVEMGLPQVTALSRTEWGAVRAVMGRPRRLSSNFLLEERRKLARYRADVRLVQQGKTPCHSLVDGPFVYQVPQPLTVGQRVTAKHPRTLTLAQGQILTTNSTRGVYRVQFDHVELGVETIADTSIIPHETVPLLYPALCTSVAVPRSPSGGAQVQPTVTSHKPHDGWVLGPGLGPVDDPPEEPRPLPHNTHAAAVARADVGGLPAGAAVRPPPPPVIPAEAKLSDLNLPRATVSPKEAAIVRADQIRVMATLTKLLRRKELLLQELNRMNARAAGMSGSYASDFQTGCLWVIVSLESTNLSLEAAQTSMRLLARREGTLLTDSRHAVSPSDMTVSVRTVLEDPVGGNPGAMDSNSRERLRFGQRKAIQTANAIVHHTVPVAVQAKWALMNGPSSLSGGAAGTRSSGRPMDPKLPHQVLSSYTRQLTMVTNAVGLLCSVHWSSQEDLCHWEVYTLLERQLAQLKPVHSANDGIFRDLQVAVATLRSSVLCVPSPASEL